MGKKKTKQQPEAAVPAKRSEIIQQSMIYVQCLAAQNAAFTVDGTGDCEYAGRVGGFFRLDVTAG
jgi:hypothetical protein